jgi:predicted metal-dependent HD superfamily phosphohydrolase
MLIEMKEKWFGLIDEIVYELDINISEEKKESWTKRSWSILKFGYGNTDREYHNFDHIEDLLNKFNLIEDKIKYPQAFKLAIWFHDVIFNPLSKHSEDDSALLARRLLDELDEELSVRVSELVLFTKWDSGWFFEGTVEDLHRNYSFEFSTMNEDFLYLRDIDWSGFGSSWGNYSKNTRQIYMESYFQSTKENKKKRIKFLEWIRNSLPKQRELFSTELFRKMLTEKAYRNIDKELKILKEELEKENE